MELTIVRNNDYNADGVYCVKTKHCSQASLFWADKDGALSDWTEFARIPLSEKEPGYCMGTFIYEGHRAIPEEATHVLAKSAADDPGGFWGCQEILVPLTKNERMPVSGNGLRLAVMSDLHLSKKPWQVRKALYMAQNADLVLVAGDLVNDGEQKQLERMQKCIEEILPGIPVLAAVGNHDYPVAPLPRIREGVCDYQVLQSWLLGRAADAGYSVVTDSCGAYAVQVGEIEIIGLNAASHWRRFVFRDGAQLKWLASHLEKSNMKWHLILCHAPLLAHNPQRNYGEPYLSRDEQLQKLIDAHQNIIFLSGHTHVSLNSPVGCVEYDEGRKNIYVNAGSIRPTTLLTDEENWPEEFVHGNVVELTIDNERVTITGISTKSGQKIARGHYVF